ncbi:MAG: hypothetical protein DWQ36_13430 [Acidobacteria bacterium]|nr:MAG: hypothetical protein DWQ30_05740 [Acidobacteriota bacterium]REK06909.1 MAG: hypothetical protein DWQ36_13430 [Acidobacteriota bacterium]
MAANVGIALLLSGATFAAPALPTPSAEASEESVQRTIAAAVDAARRDAAADLAPQLACYTGAPWLGVLRPRACALPGDLERVSAVREQLLRHFGAVVAAARPAAAVATPEAAWILDWLVQEPAPEPLVGAIRYRAQIKIRGGRQDTRLVEYTLLGAGMGAEPLLADVGAVRLELPLPPPAADAGEAVRQAFTRLMALVHAPLDTRRRVAAAAELLCCGEGATPCGHSEDDASQVARRLQELTVLLRRSGATGWGLGDAELRRGTEVPELVLEVGWLEGGVNGAADRHVRERAVFRGRGDGWCLGGWEPEG